MSTRAVIARTTQKGEGFKGVYHHNDGYPRELGKYIIGLYKYFHGDIEKMMHFIIDEHPAGWSTLDGDWKLKPGYNENYRLPQTSPKQRRAHCFCHGDRHYEENFYDDTMLSNMWDIEFLYVVNERNHEMFMQVIVNDDRLETLCTVKLKDTLAHDRVIQDYYDFDVSWVTERGYSLHSFYTYEQIEAMGIEEE